MPLSPDFLAYIEDRLAWIPDLVTKRMFGGAGLYAGGRMFAIVTDTDGLFLKADEENRALYERAGATQFAYLRQGKPMKLSYFSVSADVLEDSETLEVWVTTAVGAADRARAEKKSPSSRTQSSTRSD